MVDDGYGSDDVSRWLSGFALKVPVGEEKFRGVGKYIGKVIHLADVAREMPAWIKANPDVGIVGSNGAQPTEQQLRLADELRRQKAERQRTGTDG